MGLDKPQERRKAYIAISKELVDSNNFLAGLAVIEPGEAAALHTHYEGIEEFYYIVKGSGTVHSGGEKQICPENSFVFIPSGVEHQIINADDEPLVFIFVFAPPKESVVGMFK